MSLIRQIESHVNQKKGPCSAHMHLLLSYETGNFDPGIGRGAHAQAGEQRSNVGFANRNPEAHSLPEITALAIDDEWAVKGANGRRTAADSSDTSRGPSPAPPSYPRGANVHGCTQNPKTGVVIPYQGEYDDTATREDRSIG